MTNQTKRYIASALILSLALSPLAEAKRLGGGGNRGISRSSYSSNSYSRSYSNSGYQSNNNRSPSSNRLGNGNDRGMSRSYNNSNQNNYQSSPSNNTNTPSQQRGNGWGRTVGAGVAGAAVGLMAGHAMANRDQHNPQAAASSNTANYNEQNNENNNALPAEAQNTTPSPAAPKSGFSWIWLIIVALGGFYLYRRFAGKKNTPANPYMHHNSNTPTQSNNQSGQTNIFGQKLNTNTYSNNSVISMADGSNPEAFLRFARQRFNHVQAMNSATNLEEIRRYFTVDMFADIRNDIANNHDIAEFSNLNNELIESIEENGQYIASVRFSGLVSEQIGSKQEPFSEIWHFIKPINSQQEWLIAGIQQDN